MRASMDSQILRRLFICIRECEGVADRKVVDVAEKVKQMLDALPLITLTKDGHIREWMEDYKETEPGHCHISYLFARKTLKYRLENGGGHTGWSCAWIECFWASLKDGNKVWETIKKVLHSYIQTDLLDTHPPF